MITSSKVARSLGERQLRNLRFLAASPLYSRSKNSLNRQATQAIDPVEPVCLEPEQETLLDIILYEKQEMLQFRPIRSFYACKGPLLSLKINTMIDFFPRRSKRGVEMKTNYPNIYTRDKRSLFSMPGKRVPYPVFKPEDKR